MPTLYNTEGSKLKKPSIIELVLYNIASLLGGVAAGYDLRVSNVSPLHPTLQPHRSEVEGESAESGDGAALQFAHNTYHGPARHVRAPLHALTSEPISSLRAEEQRPLRFTDSPSQYAHASSSSGYGHTQPLSPLSPSPSTPPRRTSSTSDQLADLYHNYRENFQPKGDYYYRTTELHPYDRTADYVVKHPYVGYDEFAFEYREPEYRGGPFLSHRRTPSNSSATNSHPEEFSPSRQFRPDKYPKERREEYRSPKTEYPRKSSDYSLPRDFYQESQEVERPGNLGLELGPTKLRSSLKKYKKSSASGGSTPTNPTPPDSLSETDSSYVSAHSRVRFSPDALDADRPDRPDRPDRSDRPDRDRHT